MARHMTRHFHPLEPFDPENYVFANGVSALCEMLGFSLFDGGDTLLLSRPIYQAFRGDFGTRAKCVGRVVLRWRIDADVMQSQVPLCTVRREGPILI